MPCPPEIQELWRNKRSAIRDIIGDAWLQDFNTIHSSEGLEKWLKRNDQGHSPFTGKLESESILAVKGTFARFTRLYSGWTFLEQSPFVMKLVARLAQVEDENSFPLLDDVIQAFLAIRPAMNSITEELSHDIPLLDQGKAVLVICMVELDSYLAQVVSACEKGLTPIHRPTK
ncbi:MAG: hypothetical protein Q9174_003247 [Haloplaca sp. 1 TL-2023]